MRTRDRTKVPCITATAPALAHGDRPCLRGQLCRRQPPVFCMLLSYRRLPRSQQPASPNFVVLDICTEHSLAIPVIIHGACRSEYFPKYLLFPFEYAESIDIECIARVGVDFPDRVILLQPHVKPSLQTGVDKSREKLARTPGAKDRVGGLSGTMGQLWVG